MARKTARLSLSAPKRKRREQDALSDQQIVDSSLELIRRDGADRFSMRKLAKELGVTPMAVYYYVSSKDALFERVADEVLSRVPRPAPSGRDWRSELKATALHGFRLLSQYPGLSGQIIKRPPTKQTEELARYGIEVMVAAGVDANVAPLATMVCQSFMFGMIGLQAQCERAQKKKTKRSAGATYLEQVDVQGLAEFGFNALLAGLDEQMARAPRTKSRASAPSRRVARTA
ncbi:MAG TPA: TetR family transcriptional regulator [Polyangiales bacterium]|nr:TetR family transcriptional regulator [Polyangiales bacterium]